MYKNVVVTQEVVASSSRYCRLFKTFTKVRENENQFNDIQMIFNLTNISSSGVKKDYDRYLFTTCNGEVTLKRLTTNQTRLKVGYKIENDTNLYVYCNGGYDGARTYLNIEYVTNKSFFTFYDTASYNYLPSNLIMCTENYDYTNTLANQQPNTFKIALKTNQFNNIIKITDYNNKQPVYTVSFIITEVPSGTLTGTSSIYNITGNASKTVLSKLNSFHGSNRVNIHVVKNDDNSIDIYLTSNAYGTFIITPLTYYTENSYINYNTSNTNISNYSGSLLKKSPYVSEYKWDFTNNKPCWFNGTNWVYADGTFVP